MSDRKGGWFWLGLAVLLEAAFIALVRLPQGAGSSMRRSLVWLSAAGLVYLIAVLLTLRPTRLGLPSLRLLFWSALIFRLTLLPLTPLLTHAALRNQWEGKIQHFGFNPYPYPPSNPLFSPLQPPVQLPAPRIAAWRPPLAELLLHGAYTLFRGLRRQKIAWAALDLLLILLLFRLLRSRARPPAWALLYAWSPLAVFEVAGNGHLVPAAALLLLLALDWASRATKRAGVAAAAAALVAWYALIAVPLVFAGAGRRWKGMLTWFILAGALIWAPFLFFNRRLILPAVWHNLHQRLAAPAFNASLFPLLQSWFGTPLAWTVAVGLVAAALAGALWPRGVGPARRTSAAGGEAAPELAPSHDPLRAAFVAIGALLLVLPHVQPALALWILPFVVFFPEPAWIYFSLAVVWGYAAGHSRAWTWVEYAPLYALLGWQFWRSRPANPSRAASP